MARKKGGTPVRCDNCEFECDLEELGLDKKFGRTLGEIHHLTERLDPGSEVPAGECPECNAFMYLVEGGAKKNPKEGALIVRIAPFEGEDSTVQIYDADGNERDELFMAVSMKNGEELDNGYTSFAEIAEAWPEAVNAKLKKIPGSYMGR